MDEQQQALYDLAQRLHSWHIDGLARLFFSFGQGTSIVTSHLLLFSQPLLPSCNVRQQVQRYANALEDEQSWRTLIDYLNTFQS